jgi:hypothetical protein
MARSKLGIDGAPLALRTSSGCRPTADSPRIAIAVSGVGNASGTADAFAKCQAMTARPLRRRSESWRRARRRTTKCCCRSDGAVYPDNDPGPQTLLTSRRRSKRRPPALVDERFQGYVGLTSYMGALHGHRAGAGAGAARSPSAKVYVDDGASQHASPARSPAATICFAKTDAVLDAVQTPTEIDRALARHQMLARDNGAASALATAQPATVARIAEWAKKVEGRGFVLVDHHGGEQGESI